jgi:hypothetical protein
MAFAKWLMGRPEKQIAVVSHSGFLHKFFQNFGHGYDARIASGMHRHFNNCVALCAKHRRTTSLCSALNSACITGLVVLGVSAKSRAVCQH